MQTLEKPNISLLESKKECLVVGLSTMVAAGTADMVGLLMAGWASAYTIGGLWHLKKRRDDYLKRIDDFLMQADSLSTYETAYERKPYPTWFQEKHVLPLQTEAREYCAQIWIQSTFVWNYQRVLEHIGMLMEKFDQLAPKYAEVESALKRCECELVQKCYELRKIEGHLKENGFLLMPLTIPKGLDDTELDREDPIEKMRSRIISINSQIECVRYLEQAYYHSKALLSETRREISKFRDPAMVRLVHEAKESFPPETVIAGFRIGDFDNENMVASIEEKIREWEVHIDCKNLQSTVDLKWIVTSMIDNANFFYKTLRYSLRTRAKSHQ